MNKQRGYINFPDGFFESLMVMAAIGFVACVCLVAYGLWWLLMNVTITIGG